MTSPIFSGRTCRLLSIGLFLALATAVAQAKELKLEAKLIWGTNDEKSPKKEHVKVDEATAEKLRKVFKWKNYFVENKVVRVVPNRGSNKFELSSKCTIEITELEGPKIEVKLVGNGKPVHKTVLTISTGQSVVYSGDDKNECAWFAILTELNGK